MRNPVPETVTDEAFQKLVAARLAVTERHRQLPIEQRDAYRKALAAAGLPDLPAERTVEDCDAIWEILDELDCPPIPTEDFGDEPF